MGDGVGIVSRAETDQVDIICSAPPGGVSMGVGTRQPIDPVPHCMPPTMLLPRLGSSVWVYVGFLDNFSEEAMRLSV